MKSLMSDNLKKLANMVLGQAKITPESIKIFFSAPNPDNPTGDKSLDLKSKDFKEANFQWVAYQLLFSVGDKYYIYNVNLDPSGEAKPPDKVFESSVDWDAKNKNNPTKDLSPGDVVTSFPKLLKGVPEKNPVNIIERKNIIYTNIVEGKGKDYSYDEFKRLFDKDFYIVLDKKTRELKKPFGGIVGKNPENNSIEEQQAIKKSSKKVNPKDVKPLSGGKDIIEKLVKRLDGLNVPKNIDYDTGGFDIIQKLRGKTPPETSEGLKSDFDVMQQLVKNPVPIKKK